MERVVWTACSLGVILYSIWVLYHVAWMGTIGVRCMFGTKVEEEIPADYAWEDQRPQKGDELLAIGDRPISGRCLRRLCGLHPGDARLNGQIGRTIEVRWRDHASRVRCGRAARRCNIRRAGRISGRRSGSCRSCRSSSIGARVFWKRPNDDSARLFFVLCIVTVGAFMGGYHWTEIVFQPALIYLFALFAVFVPVVNLHFYLVFPRPNPILVRHRRWVLGVLYGAATT